MKNQLRIALASMLCLAVPLMPAIASDYASNISQVIAPRQDCGHVMRLLMCYGDRCDGRTNAIWQHTPNGPSVLLAPEIGDLELVSLVQLSPCTDILGPTYQVTVRNNSPREVCRFSVTTVAVLGRLRLCSPATTVVVEKLCAGEIASVQLQLPIECLAMGMADGQPLAFQTLVVAIDSFDEFAECDESNNLLVVERAKVPLAEEVVDATEAAPENEDSALPPPNELPETEQPSPPGSTSLVPSGPRTLAPGPTSLDDIDIDKLDLDDSPES